MDTSLKGLNKHNGATAKEMYKYLIASYTIEVPLIIRLM